MDLTERKEEGKHRPFIAWFLRYICTGSSAARQQPYNVPRPSDPGGRVGGRAVGGGVHGVRGAGAGPKGPHFDTQ